MYDTHITRCLFILKYQCMYNVEGYFLYQEGHVFICHAYYIHALYTCIIYMRITCHAFFFPVKIVSASSQCLCMHQGTVQRLR